MKKGQRIFNSGAAGLLCSLLTMVPAAAQTSLFQDASGESAYKVLGTAVSLNPANENISASADIYYGRKPGPDSGTNFRRLGIFAKVSANEGLVNLTPGPGLLIDGEIGLYHSWTRTSAITDPDAWVRVFYLNGNLLTDRTRVYDAANLAQGASTRGYWGWKLETGTFGFRGNYLWGVALNGGSKTNMDYLGPHTIAYLYPASNDSILVWQTDRGYEGSLLKSGLGYLNGNIDLAYLINRRAVTRSGREIPPIFVAMSLRYRVLEKELPLFNPGLGVYLSKIGAPQDVMLGLSLQLQDAFDVARSETAAWKRTVLNLTVGYKFGN